ncbi:RNA helicase [Purpureocillium takamizusanense]|uniref:ATP-dependent RNA helicase n=1 Tax=Purpureocillium takamizusanense TaxID=2060973 RepID=A0A9Q8QI99_9HYPO|nr:RNA helicase [Purpureocillium takamizusanense]UNI20293.1 RNA helicase [Purpureocillium takamizusanense]
MYARYIPPAKGAKPSSAPTSSPVQTRPAAVQASPAAEPRDVTSYARYVPPAKSAPKEPEPTPTVQYFDDEPSPPKPKRKRDAEEPTGPQGTKKTKTVGDAPAAVKATTSPTEPSGDAAPKKKKNRRKRKQRTKAAESDSDDSDAEAPRPDTVSAKTPDDGDIQVDVPAATNKELKRDKQKKKKEKKAKHQEPEPILEAEVSPEPQQKPDDAAAPEGEDDVIMADADNVAQDTEMAAPEEPAPSQEKKRRKEKKKKAVEIDPAEEQLQREQEDARHKAVLERKAKSLKLAQEVRRETDDSDQEPEELHGLEPLPQPKVVEDEEVKPTYDTLPAWLANPTRVSQDMRASFKDLGIPPKAVRVLEQKGFPEAFAVQTAAIPLLLPTSKHRPGDVLVSAATGSGKTLAYALPIVRDISQGVVTRLRALVVLPTRELVKQAQDVFEVCAKAFDGDERKRVRIGVAVGSQSIKSEQEALMSSESRYDPEVYQEILKQSQEQRRRNATIADIDEFLDQGTEERDPRLGLWDGQVIDHSSSVDVLICTPGRLVEHIEQTPGLSLDYVRWLVVDEADKLLAQSFQGWLDLVMEKFQVDRFSARDFPDMAYSGVRKVVLSATLTRDLSLLNQLALRRPQLIVLESDGSVPIAEHTLPALLQEFAIRVHETNLKPLYLLDLLLGPYMKAGLADTEVKDVANTKDVAESESSSDSSSDSDSSSESSSSDSDSTSDSDSSADEPAKPPAKSQLPHCLIFTKSNESALRLSRLLAILDDTLSAHISTLTSTTPTHIRRKTLRAFLTPSSPIRLIVASDLVARGIDIPKLGHVINYDLPASAAGYVHRVGRTARAGRSGCAWTLVGDEESGWFWGKIAKGQGVRRAQKVERTKIDEMSEERVQDYEKALAKLGKEALEVRRR